MHSFASLAAGLVDSGKQLESEIFNPLKFCQRTSVKTPMHGLNTLDASKWVTSYF